MTRTRIALFAVGAVVLIALPLATVPERPPTIAPSEGTPFVWDAQPLWDSLEQQFRVARADCTPAGPAVDHLRADAEALPLDAGPDHLALMALEDAAFEAAALAAACPDHADAFVAAADLARRQVKEAARTWDLDSDARDRLYRLLYGTRLATEEVSLRRTGGPVAFDRLDDVPSAAPSIEVQGVRIHSGDLLVSRGGAPTSALIARGNDRPGNFSHVALAHVDAETGAASVVEAHIESGVGIFTAEQYLADTKLRVLVLRLRPDDPAVQADPLVAHRAAEAAYAAARAGHIPYDFGMDSTDDAKQFCSEVPLHGYRAVGIELWPGPTTVSDAGTMGLFAAFGVRTSKLLAPSDLEYSPRLVAAAEWRDTEQLRKDRIDNAVIDAMISRVGTKDGLPAAQPHLLPPARAAKAWSWLLNRMGKKGPIPEGMSASRALRVRSMSWRHGVIRERLEELLAEREAADGYVAPYWTVVALAEQAADATQIDPTAKKKRGH